MELGAVGTEWTGGAARGPRGEHVWLLVAVLLGIAGATLRVDPIGRHFADDGKVNHEIFRIGIPIAQGALVVAAVAAIFLRRSLARRKDARGLAAAAVTLAAVGAGIGGTMTVVDLLPRPWERAGMPMTQRLALLAEAKKNFFGETPEQLQKEIPAGESPAAARAHFELGTALGMRGEYEAAAAEYQETMARVARLPMPADASEAAALRDLANQAEKELSGAFLRLGETDNCIRHHCGESCIFPIAGGGVHTVKTGSQRAMEVLRSLYAKDPTDLTSKWLYNVAAMTLGDYPDRVPPELLAPPEFFASEHPMPRFVDVAVAAGIRDDRLAGGVILDDFDGDGDIDVVTSSASLADSLRYYRNEGDGTFVERTHEAHLEGLTHGLSISEGDFDNDGDPDISVVRGAWMRDFGTLPMSLLRNEGDGTFTDVTEAAGMMTFFPGQVAEWADFDNDGWLDLFVGHESTPEQKSPSLLFHNNKDGTFTDVIEDVGIDRFGFVKGAAWGDYDHDGWIDLYVSRRAEPSRLYHNVAAPGGGRRFDDVSEAAGIRGDYQSFSAWFFDFDNDGDLDLFSATYGKTEHVTRKDPWRVPVAEIGPAMLHVKDADNAYCRLFRNNGDGTFTDVAEEMGLQRVVLVMGANFGDLDNDGWLDLYLGTGNPSYRALIPNKAFRNDHGRRFQDVTSATGLGHLQKGHAIAFADMDNDGDEDVYADMGGFFPSDTFANALYENPGCGNHWITLRLHGTQTNRRAVGVRLKVAVDTPSGPRDIYRMVGCASSFGASSVQQEIGLGDATAIRSVTVEWPVSKTTQVFTDLTMERVVDLTEGDAKARVSEPHPFKLKSDGADCCPPAAKPDGPN